MPNRLLLTLANQEGLARFSMENPVLRPMVLRFVAGEHLSDAVEVVRGLNARGIRAIAAADLDANISVKLTAIGLDIADSVAAENLRVVLDAARAYGTFVRVDMEGSPYTGRTLELVEHMWAAGYDNVGPVIQAYLYRSAADVERLVRQGM